MGATSVESKTTPPYLPWKTFKGFLEGLKSSVIPARIDPSVLRGMSGSAQSQMRTGMRFLDLIDDDGAVTAKLRQLVGAVGTPEWAGTLANALTESYHPIIKSLDLNTATPHQLRENFRERGNVEGSVNKKAVRFYLSALSEAGISYSPFLTVRASPAPRSKPRTTTQRNSNSRNGPAPATDYQPAGITPPPGTRQLQLALPGKPDAVLHLPEAITEAEWEMISMYVKNFISLRRDT